jgi:hypothetical protein
MVPRTIGVVVSGALAMTVVSILAVSARPAAQTSPLTNKYFSSYARAHRVTISRNGTVVTRLDVPAGVWLSVYSDQEPVRTDQDGRLEFHGNIEIRTLPNADVRRPGSGDATDMMAQAPLIVAAQNVDVLSETLIP